MTSVSFTFSYITWLTWLIERVSLYNMREARKKRERDGMYYRLIHEKGC